jgi:hypothetical protein
MSTTFVATPGLETAPIQEGSVLYAPSTGKFIMLNQSAAFLWNVLSSPRTEDDLTGALRALFPEVTSLRQDVGEALEQLAKLDLVVNNGESTGTEAATSAPKGVEGEGRDRPAAYERPSLRVLDEDELLNIFQMTAAEISVASCWWYSCPAGCP